MTYNPQTWHDNPATDTPITAAALTHIEQGISSIDQGLAAISRPWQFLVPAPSGGDDTSAINTAVSNAITYAKAHNYYAEVIFQAGAYNLASSPSAGASGTCNAIVPIDPVPVAGQKLVLVLRGAVRQAALYHWQQTTAQTAGTTIKTAYAGGTVPTAGNEPSVIGGPTPHFGYGESVALFSNMHLIIDGIGVVVPQNPEVCGFDFRGIAEVTIVSASALAVSAGTGAPVRPDSSSGLWSSGLLMPQCNNNDICDVLEYSCEGFANGMWAEEHVSLKSARFINCYNGLLVQPSSGFPHGNHFSYISAENCFRPVVFSGGATAKAVIDLMDVEWDASTGGAIVSAVAGTSTIGQIQVCANGSSGASLSAAMSSGINANSGISGMKVINSDMASGPWAGAPAVPASTVSQANTAWRDATIYVTGTVTGIKINGTSVQSGSVTNPIIRVPSGGSVALTYSSAPTWWWVLD